MLEVIDSTLARINLAAVIDHSGRGGNAFFLTSFDQHPQILCCPLLHYSYSYVLSHFGDSNLISGSEAKDFLVEKSYFRLLAQPYTQENQTLIERMGAKDLDIPYQRINQLVDDYFCNKSSVTRKELICLPFLFLALAQGRTLCDYQYVLISDAVSLRQESLLEGFSGKAVDAMVNDFPMAKLISIVRDPRATFASPRHQFVNQLGNMYAYQPGNYFSRLKGLLSEKWSSETSCIYLYWLLYLQQSTQVIYRLRSEYKTNFKIVKNEDLNGDFNKTTRAICDWLLVEQAPKWLQGDFSPTILGKPWLGTGAYNSRYQTQTNGLLANDSSDVSQKAAGPNLYVTQRWKTKLSKREIGLIEGLFEDELRNMGYPLMYPPSRSTGLLFLSKALGPFIGELPSIAWLMKGYQQGLPTFFQRLFYTATFGPFYLLSRWKLWQYMTHKAVFNNQQTRTLLSPKMFLGRL